MTRRQSTYRPQNTCHSCGYTWYPRGKDVSLICPNCGSYETGIDFSGLIGFLLLIGLCVGLAYYSWVLFAVICFGFYKLIKYLK
jgi:hypothetical protein